MIILPKNVITNVFTRFSQFLTAHISQYLYCYYLSQEFVFANTTSRYFVTTVSKILAGAVERGL